MQQFIQAGSSAVGLTIRTLARKEVAAAIGICARGMRDNPVHVRVFGTDPHRRRRRLERLFAGLLPWIQHRGSLVGAWSGPVLIGVLGLLPPGTCMPTRLDMLRLLPALARCHTPTGLMRVQRWLSAWAANDLPAPHWHLGPLAVEPGLQRRGVGSRLLQHCLAGAEGSAAALYLETDKPDNVVFYERRGFEVIATLPVLGTPTWLLRRQPAAGTGDGTADLLRSF